jgi:hypothetical protein
MVNVPNIERVIASIKGLLPETAHVGFNMGTYASPVDGRLADHSGRNCKWVGCMGGHAYMIDTGASVFKTRSDDADEIEEIAAGYLGLDEDQARALFFDLPAYLRLEHIPQQVAIAVLERLARTGRVSWEEETYAAAA